MRWLALAFLLVGCASTLNPKSANKEELCCNRLKAAKKEVKKFERLCIAAVFAEDRFDDPNAKKIIKETLSICKYVFEVKE